MRLSLLSAVGVSLLRSDGHPDPSFLNRGLTPRIAYSENCKGEVVRLATQDGPPRNRFARDLGISVGALRAWIHRYAPGEAVVSNQLPEAEQICQPKRELDRLRQEREILKKPSAPPHTELGGVTTRVSTPRPTPCACWPRPKSPSPASPTSIAWSAGVKAGGLE